MKIGIIGAGNIGSTLTRRLTALGHEVSVANSRGPGTLAGLAAETGATAVSVPDAVKDRDLVVVTIPEKHISDLPAGLFAAAPERVIVVDTGNYYPRQRDGRIDGIEKGLTESRWVERQLGRPVIKAFNNIYAKDLMERGLPRAQPGASRYRLQAMIKPPKRLYCGWLTNSASMEWMPAAWMNPGASSPALRSTRRTWMPKA